MLRFMLRAPDGIITNPCLQNEHEIHEGADQSVKYPGYEYFRPNILATCSFLNFTGTPILYEYNTFRITRKIFDGSENEFDKIVEFFAFHHEHRFGAGAGDFHHRSKLIKKFCLHDSDTDNDSYAEMGIAKPNGDIDAEDVKAAWQYRMLRHMEWLGFNLRTLTVTFDQAAPNIVRHLQYESKARQLSGPPGGCYDIFREEEVHGREWRWSIFKAPYYRAGENLELIESPFPYQIGGPIHSKDGLRVRKLYVRGTATTNDDDRHYLMNGKLRVKNAVAKEIINWMETTSICPQQIEFTGAFAARNVDEADGAIIPDELWQAMNLALPFDNDTNLLRGL
jgi:hypothetical protein